MPPHLAGRTEEVESFLRLLEQKTILENYILTGLRGVGKTVLLERLKPQAQTRGWRWVGADLSESASIREQDIQEIGFGGASEKKRTTAEFPVLMDLYNRTPGLAVDKLKTVLEFSWSLLKDSDNFNGVIFAYDEAQNFADHATKDQFPVSLLLDTFQSIQRKGIPFMLVLAGLPTLFPKLVDSRTFAERMFRVVILARLTQKESREAILVPLKRDDCPIKPTKEDVDLIVEYSHGYPYFIQFMCKEVYDVWVITPNATIPLPSIIEKLDTDFFAGRWAKTTDRQRELLCVIAKLEGRDEEFTVAEIVAQSKVGPPNPFSGSHVNQMLASLGMAGLVYKNRHGKYSFAVPLLGDFIQRQI